MQAQWVAELFQAHAAALAVLGVISLVTFVGTLIALPLLIIYLPLRYLDPSPAAAGRRPMSVPRILLLALRNAVGAVLVAAGVAMLVLPGQGLVTLLIGLALMSVPGKRRLLRRLLRQPGVLAFINRVRTAARRPPIAPPD